MSAIQELSPKTRQFAVDHHPWRALLLLTCIAERPTLTFIDGQSPIGRNVIHQISCEQWISCLRQLRDHFQSNTPHQKNLARQTSLIPLSRTIQRMGISQMKDFQDVDPPAMERRFGKLVATAWQWTLRGKHLASPARSLFSDIFTDDFPWTGVLPKEIPAITRHLDHPIQLWEHIEPCLRDDLDRICNLTSWSSSERVVSLEWELSFSCSPPLRIPVLFRHPHALHSESGHHKTALLQAFHSWQQSCQHPSRATRDSKDTFIAGDSITEWKIQVSGRMVSLPQHRRLFADDLSTDSSHLLRLENQLSVPLCSYAETNHWTPERAFAPGLSATDENTPPHRHIARTVMNQRRPLFLYSEPEIPTGHPRSSGLIFSERVGTDWWSDIDLNHEITCRDYYVRMTDDGLLQWVYYTDDGTLKVHGIYG
jgi:hypothetical protein